MTLPTGVIQVRAGADAVVFTRTFDVAAQQVWAMISRSELTARWFGTFTGDPAEGHVMVSMNVEGDDNATPIRYSVDRCEPPRLLQVSSSTDVGDWDLELRVEPAGAGSTLSFGPPRHRCRLDRQHRAGLGVLSGPARRGDRRHGPRRRRLGRLLPGDAALLPADPGAAVRSLTVRYAGVGMADAPAGSTASDHEDQIVRWREPSESSVFPPGVRTRLTTPTGPSCCGPRRSPPAARRRAA